MIPVTAARFADDGTLWIRREDSEAAVQTWELHDPRGAVRAVVTLPKGLDVKLINEDFLWGVETDELDVPYVVRYRLQRPR